MCNHHCVAVPEDKFAIETYERLKRGEAFIDKEDECNLIHN